MHSKLICRLIFFRVLKVLYFIEEISIRDAPLRISGAHFSIVHSGIHKRNTNDYNVGESDASSNDLQMVKPDWLCNWFGRISNTSIDLCLFEKYLTNHFPIFQASPRFRLFLMTRLLRGPYPLKFFHPLSKQCFRLACRNPYEIMIMVTKGATRCNCYSGLQEFSTRDKSLRFDPSPIFGKT